MYLGKPSDDAKLLSLWSHTTDTNCSKDELCQMNLSKSQTPEQNKYFKPLSLAVICKVARGHQTRCLGLYSQQVKKFSDYSMQTYMITFCNYPLSESAEPQPIALFTSDCSLKT